MTDTKLSPLDELLARAGASDKDREAWLTQRLDGITATQVRELYLQGAGYRADLLKQKVHRITEALIVGNRYIDWGNEREPIIAEWARRFGVEPESRVFHAAENRRLLASPDGFGENFDGDLIISEIKTGKDDLRPGGEAYERKGYGIQMQWGMRVTGARKCLYAWEQHDSDWQDRGGVNEQPRPLYSEPQFAWIDYDPLLGAELEVLALGFLDDLDSAIRDAADGVGPEIDDALDTMGVNYLRFLEEEKAATTAKKTEWTSMLERLEGCDALSQESTLARVTYSPGEEMVSEAPDVEAAKVADPDLFAEVQALSKRWNEHQAKFKKEVISPAKPTLRVTSPKAKEQTK